MKLHLGVIDAPYTARRSSLTTVDVARILEKKYRVMRNFYDHDRDFVSDALADSARDALESVLSGAPPTADPFASAGDAIRKRFDDFILSGVVERIGIPGVPTAAALRGTSGRRKKPHAKGARRPSFFYTGTYVGAFRAWVG